MRSLGPCFPLLCSHVLLSFVPSPTVKFTCLSLTLRVCVSVISCLTLIVSCPVCIIFSFASTVSSDLVHLGSLYLLSVSQCKFFSYFAPVLLYILLNQPFASCVFSEVCLLSTALSSTHCLPHTLQYHQI